MLTLTLATTIHIGVLGSFHPAELTVKPAGKAELYVVEDGRAEVVHVREWTRIDGPAKITGRKGSFARFVICLPNGSKNEYYGRLEVRRHFDKLQLIVEMDPEVAVASILAAEAADALPTEALRAQAIVARSYMLAVKGRHSGFDMCDTTHCQKLGPPPAANSAATKAALATKGQVLTYRGKIVPALYSANCGGRTRPFGSSDGPDGYSFPSVACSRHGHVSGHGVGLCQLGAREMARNGATAFDILAHYFPGTQLARNGAAEPESTTFPTAWHPKSPGRSRQTLGGPTADMGAHGVWSAPGKFAPPASHAPVHAAASSLLAQAVNRLAASMQ
jgi:hypothetical protein